MKVKSLSRVQVFATPWTVDYHAPQSTEFSRQQYWSGLPFPSLGDLPDPGIELGSPAWRVDALPSEPSSCLGSTVIFSFQIFQTDCACGSFISVSFINNHVE